MIELIYMLNVPDWKKAFISYAFHPDYYSWLPDHERSFWQLLSDTDAKEWHSCKKAGWMVMKDDVPRGMIWGTIHDDDAFSVNVHMDDKLSGRDKLLACKIGEDVLFSIGIQEIIGNICAENKRSLAFARYMGYAVNRKYRDIRDNEMSEYIEVSKCL